LRVHSARTAKRKLGRLNEKRSPLRHDVRSGDRVVNPTPNLPSLRLGVQLREIRHFRSTCQFPRLFEGTAERRDLNLESSETEKNTALGIKNCPAGAVWDRRRIPGLRD
jgi:hypothetical protein